jgi:hypothetical protein
MAVVVSGWGFGLVPLLWRKEYSRTTVPPYLRTPEFRTTDLRLQSYDAMTTIPNFRPIFVSINLR